MKIKGSQKSMRGLRLVGEEENGNAFSLYGPVKAGLTTLPTTNEVRLMELLSSLENVVHDLNYKSFTAYDTLNTAIEDLRAALLDTTSDEDGTEDVVE